jgi:hypothetical protein
MPRDPTLATVTCPCGAPPFAIRPGVEPVRRGAIDLWTRLDPLIDGRVDQVWCLVCWSKRFGRRAA